MLYHGTARLYHHHVDAYTHAPVQFIYISYGYINTYNIQFNSFTRNVRVAEL